MRKVLGRMVRRYLEVTSRSLRTFDQDRPVDLRRPPIDLRDRRRRIVDLDAEVIELDDPARREQ